jgi:hypothetical protein
MAINVEDLNKSITNALATETTGGARTTRIAMLGSSALTTRTYGVNDLVASKFNPGVVFGQPVSEEDVCIIYGEVWLNMASPDKRIQVSSEDPNVKLANLIGPIMEGPTVGIVGDTVEKKMSSINVNGCPVVDPKSGRSNWGDIAAYALTGLGALTSLSKIAEVFWPSTDPVTGKPIKNAKPKSVTPTLEDLPNVEAAGCAGDKQILHFDASTGKWTPISLNQLFNQLNPTTSKFIER